MHVELSGFKKVTLMEAAWESIFLSVKGETVHEVYVNSDQLQDPLCPFHIMTSVPQRTAFQKDLLS